MRRFDARRMRVASGLILGLLLEHLPPPDGVMPAEFYGDLSPYVAQIDLARWNNGEPFAAGLRARVIDPGIHADALLQTWPYLTRMYTTISPTEMMEDPIFHLNPDLEPVPNLRTAQNLRLCNGDSVVTLPDARELYIPGGSLWWLTPGDTWYAEKVQQIAAAGAAMTTVDNTAAIDKKLAAWNAAYGWPRSADTDTGSSSSSDGEQGGTGGCGCRYAGADGSQGLLWLSLPALGLLASRRRLRARSR